MSAPSPPADNSLAVEQSRQAAAAESQRQADLKEAQKKSDLAALRTSSGVAAHGNANQYFQNHGLDPSQYSGDIDSFINTKMAGIAPDDPNPGTYFNNVGEDVFNSAQNTQRSKSLRDVNALFSPNFETSRVPFTLDDPYLAGIEGEQRASADAIINNMLNRGVITATGKQAAVADLDRQRPTVNSRLNEIGTGTLASEQNALRDIANRGRQSAQTLNLGDGFDASTFGNEADTNFNDFISKLGDSLRSKTPGNLYNTSGLGTLAGIGQGAQNTPFNPAALGGLTDDDSNTPKPKAPTENVF